MAKRTPVKPQIIQFASEMLKTLGHPARLAIVELLDRSGELPGYEIQAHVGGTQSGISQHLNQMRRLGILRARRVAREVLYSVESPYVLELLECVRGLPENPRHKF